MYIATEFKRTGFVSNEFFAGHTPGCILKLFWNKCPTKHSPVSVELEMGNLSCGKITVPVNNLSLPLWRNKINNRSTLRPDVQTGKWLECHRKPGLQQVHSKI